MAGDRASPRLCSRRIVIVPPSRRQSHALTSSPKMRCLSLLLARDCCDWRAEDAQLAAMQKVISFVFNDFLASFPLFLYFFTVHCVSPGLATSNPAAFPVSGPEPEPARCKKGANSASNAVIVH